MVYKDILVSNIDATDSEFQKQFFKILATCLKIANLFLSLED
jgi:hypothetical protein